MEHDKVAAEPTDSLTENRIKIWQKRRPKRIYADQLICFSALAIMAASRNGMRAVVLVMVSILTSIIVDMICCKMSKKVYNPRDLSTIAAGFCIALMMPASISYILIICGSALAIGVKHIFGGKDNYIFNPTAVTLAFLIICYPSQLLLYPKPGEILPIFGEITSPLSSGIQSYLIKLGAAQDMSWLDVVLGNFQGPMGTSHVLIIIVCALCLLFRRSISGMVTITSLSTIVIVATLFPLHEGFLNTLVYELIGGYLLFGLLFLANDPQTVPKSQLGKLYYGISIGVLAMLFRYFGKVEGSFVFALLAANALSIRLDKYAQNTMSFLYMVSDSLRRRMSSYEKFKETAKKGETRSIYDTQEIVIDPTNYDMPPIDNKVIKINRKKSGFLKKTREKLAHSSDKGTEAIYTSTPKAKKDNEEVLHLDVNKHLREQFRDNFTRISNVVEKTKKKFSKVEVVAPTRHASQATEISEKIEQPEIAVEPEIIENDIDIIDFDEILSEDKNKE